MVFILKAGENWCGGTDFIGPYSLAGESRGGFSFWFHHVPKHDKNQKENPFLYSPALLEPEPVAENRDT